MIAANAGGIQLQRDELLKIWSYFHSCLLWKHEIGALYKNKNRERERGLGKERKKKERKIIIIMYY